MFPNRYAVYIHDTSARPLLARRYRALSHGCIRVDAPERLATALLAPQGWTADQVRSAMGASPRTAVALDKQVPIHLLYMTTWVDDDGIVQFRPDVYGRDAEAIGHP
jgi:murein L,D-transpeptidase YcbB/YkuD